MLNYDAALLSLAAMVVSVLSVILNLLAYRNMSRSIGMQEDLEEIMRLGVSRDEAMVGVRLLWPWWRSR